MAIAGHTGDALASLPLIERALAHEDALKTRTEGLTWMAWGGVLALVLLSYAATSPLVREDGPGFWLTVLWVPWVLAGAAFTTVLWRTAGLVLPLPPARPAGLVVTLAWIGAILVAFGALSALPDTPNPESAPVAAVGVAWLLMGAFNLFRATPTGRRVLLAIGAVTLLAGLALTFLVPAPAWHAPGADAARAVQDLARAVVVGLVPFLAGAWQALRG